MKGRAKGITCQGRVDVAAMPHLFMYASMTVSFRNSIGFSSLEISSCVISIAPGAALEGKAHVSDMLLRA